MDIAPTTDTMENETSDETPEFTCEGCGTELTYSGRGRHPKWCDDCKPKKSTTTRKSTKKTDTLIEQITVVYEALGSALGYVEPLKTDAMIVSASASTMAQSWGPLIEKDPKIRRFWEQVTSGGGWGTVIFSHAMVAMAIMHAHDVKLPMPNFGATKENTTNV